MQVSVKGRNISITEALERHAQEKIERVGKFFDEQKSDTRAEVELSHQRNASIPEPNVAEATLFINGNVLKARVASEDMYASIDKMSDKLERQVKRYRGRQVDRWHGKKGQSGSSKAQEGGPIEQATRTEDELETRIVRTKQFQMKPMTSEEAALQMELLDHAFFVFTSAETGDINVVYRRRDGDYGLIEPVR